jgi:hypothetical protein
MTKARADLHVHSKHSSKPSEWILRQFRAPESYTEPLDVYRLCRERGMDFVTISDHDCIDGALEIAHLPGTFLSSEVTVEFPEDGCQVHCLVTGVTEDQHREIQRLRHDIYQFRDYLRERDILYSVAHPLFRVNDRLTLDQLEKLLVLFNRFEGINGIHDRRANNLVRRIFSSLTPEVIAHLAERHRLEPLGPHPWIKTFTGGSDDHGGFYVATTWTATPAAATVEEYLGHLRAGQHEPGGDTGSTLRLVQSLYSITWEYYRRRFPALLGNRKDPFAELLRSLAQPGIGREEERSGLRERLAQVVAFPGTRRAATVETADSPAEPVDRLTFAAVGRAQRESLSSLADGFVRQLRRGRLAESLSALTHLAPLALSIAPYLVAVQAQHKDADLLEAAALRFLGHFPEGDHPGKKALFTDALTGVEGATEPIRLLASLAKERGCEMVAVTCGGGDGLPAGLRVRSFEPLMELPLPGGEPRALRVPPVLEMIDLAERERYSEILISTLGPIGLAGLAAGKLLGIRRTGVYHTDFPLYVRRLAGSPALEDLAWVYMRWFFGQMDRVYVASSHERDRLIERGFDRARLEILPRDVDTSYTPVPGASGERRAERSRIAG